MNHFEQKTTEKREKFLQMAEKFRKESEQAYAKAMGEIEHIPPGQPILVDHYSANRHRNALKKHDPKMRKCIKLDEKAKYYEGKGKMFVPGGFGISSDNPEAITHLQEKLENTSTPWVRQQVKKRIECLEAMAEKSVEVIEIDGGFTIELNPTENRIRLFTPAKPQASTIMLLKKSAYRWTPSLGCWQTHYTHPNKAEWHAKKILPDIIKNEKESTP